MKIWLLIIFALSLTAGLLAAHHDQKEEGECQITGWRNPTFDEVFRCEQNRQFGSYDCDAPVEEITCKEKP